jgi:hypothetical protein
VLVVVNFRVNEFNSLARRLVVVIDYTEMSPGAGKKLTFPTLSLYWWKCLSDLTPNLKSLV